MCRIKRHKEGGFQGSEDEQEEEWEFHKMPHYDEESFEKEVKSLDTVTHDPPPALNLKHCSARISF